VQLSGDGGNRLVGPAGRVVAGRLLSPFVPQTITSFTVRPNRSDLEHLATLLEQGTVRAVVDTVYALDDAVDAVAHVERGRSRGKVIVAVGAGRDIGGAVTARDGAATGAPATGAS
jgi:NADPH:quinone reductase-like Zn-dependent oxidoreductase